MFLHGDEGNNLSGLRSFWVGETLCFRSLLGDLLYLTATYDFCAFYVFYPCRLLVLGISRSVGHASFRRRSNSRLCLW